MKRIGDHHTRYYDGSGGGAINTMITGVIHNNLIPGNRRRAGANMGYNQAKEIFESLKDGETIKIVTHSMGGAYGKGFLQGLRKYAKEHGIDFNKMVEFEVDMAPFQPLLQKAVDFIKTIVIAHKWDGVAGSSPMDNAKNYETRTDKRENRGVREHSVNSFTQAEIDTYIPKSGHNGSHATWEQNGDLKQQK